MFRRGGRRRVLLRHTMTETAQVPVPRPRRADVADRENAMCDGHMPGLTARIRQRRESVP